MSTPDTDKPTPSRETPLSDDELDALRSTLPRLRARIAQASEAATGDMDLDTIEILTERERFLATVDILKSQLTTAHGDSAGATVVTSMFTQADVDRLHEQAARTGKMDDWANFFQANDALAAGQRSAGEGKAGADVFFRPQMLDGIKATNDAKQHAVGLVANLRLLADDTAAADYLSKMLTLREQAVRAKPEPIASVPVTPSDVERALCEADGSNRRCAIICRSAATRDCPYKHDVLGKKAAAIMSLLASSAPPAAQGAEGMGETRDARQKRVADFCAAAFGIGQSSSIEQRGLRLLEEAIEAYQSCGCSPDTAHKLVDFIFAKPADPLWRELGGVGITLLALANAAGLSADVEERRELDRVLAKPLAHFTARNQAKNDAGFMAESVIRRQQGGEGG